MWLKEIVELNGLEQKVLTDLMSLSQEERDRVIAEAWKRSWEAGEDTTDKIASQLGDTLENTNAPDFPSYFTEAIEKHNLHDWMKTVGVRMEEYNGKPWFRFENLGIWVYTKDSSELHFSIAKRNAMIMWGELPEDIDYGKYWKYEGRENNLFPEDSRIDKIISTLPGKIDNEKRTVFSQVMNMDWTYRTNTPYTGNATERKGDRVRYCFNSVGWDRNGAPVNMSNTKSRVFRSL